MPMTSSPCFILRKFNRQQMPHADDVMVTNSGGSRKFWWGGMFLKNFKNSVVFTKIESDFSPKFKQFLRQIPVVSKKKKKRSSPKLRVIFRPKSEIQTFFFAQIQVVSKKKKKKKKKKKVFTKFGTDFSPDSSR